MSSFSSYILVTPDGQKRFGSLYQAMKDGDVVQLELKWNELEWREQEILKSKTEFEEDTEFAPLHRAIQWQREDCAKFLLVRSRAADNLQGFSAN